VIGLMEAARLRASNASAGSSGSASASASASPARPSTPAADAPPEGPRAPSQVTSGREGRVLLRLPSAALVTAAVAAPTPVVPVEAQSGDPAGRRGRGRRFGSVTDLFCDDVPVGESDTSAPPIAGGPGPAPVSSRAGARRRHGRSTCAAPASSTVPANRSARYPTARRVFRRVVVDNDQSSSEPYVRFSNVSMSFRPFPRLDPSGPPQLPGSSPGSLWAHRYVVCEVEDSIPNRDRRGRSCLRRLRLESGRGYADSRRLPRSPQKSRTAITNHRLPNLRPLDRRTKASSLAITTRPAGASIQHRWKGGGRTRSRFRWHRAPTRLALQRIDMRPSPRPSKGSAS